VGEKYYLNYELFFKENGMEELEEKELHIEGVLFIFDREGSRSAAIVPNRMYEKVLNEVEPIICGEIAERDLPKNQYGEAETTLVKEEMLKLREKWALSKENAAEFRNYYTSKCENQVQYVRDADGVQTAIILPIAAYLHILDDLDDALTFKILDEDDGEEDDGESVPWEVLRAELDAKFNGLAPSPESFSEVRPHEYEIYSSVEEESLEAA
jgi:hypothetical protein